MNPPDLYSAVFASLAKVPEPAKNETYLTLGMALELATETSRFWFANSDGSPNAPKLKALKFAVSKSWTGMQSYDFAWTEEGASRPSEFVQIKLDNGPKKLHSGREQLNQPTGRFTDFLHDALLLACDWEMDGRRDTRYCLAFLSPEAAKASYHWRSLLHEVPDGGSQKWSLILEPSAVRTEGRHRQSYLRVPERVIQPETYSQLRAVTSYPYLRTDMPFYNQPERLEIDFKVRKGAGAYYSFLIAEVTDLRLTSIPLLCRWPSGSPERSIA